MSKLYEEDNHLIYFKDLNSNDIYKFKKYNIQILSYLIDGKKYYARNNEILVNEYTKKSARSKHLHKGLWSDFIRVEDPTLKSNLDAQIPSPRTSELDFKFRWISVLYLRVGFQN